MHLRNLDKNHTMCFQDPVVFSGSIRENLDPFRRYTDSEIWNSLKHSYLYDFAISKHGLDFECGDDGSNMR